MSFILYFWRLPLAAAILSVPAWWAAGRLQSAKASPFFRLLCALGLALVGYVAFVNLLGRLTGNSIAAVVIYLLLNAAAGGLLLRRRPPEEFRPIGVFSSWRAWLGPVLLACALSVPQMIVAVSTPFWDEVASSAIHVTAPNQFAEGVFPPRHNALPDIPIKYHYAFTILSGTAKLLLGLSANVSIDLVSTGLWFFIFLFVYFWLLELEFDALESAWGAFAVLLGGGLSWLYLPRIETYDSLYKVPPASELLHKYDPAKSWLNNLIAAAAVPSQHLRNADGSLSNLPWDIAAQFQQHAVSLGIALTLVALYLFTTWRKRRDLDRPLLAANVVAFSVVFLGHAVFGTVAAAAAGACLLLNWLRRPTRPAFVEGLVFGAGVGALALLHGGMLSRGAQYGKGGGFATLRRAFGYSAGGLAGFIHWNIAGFGLPLVFAVAALYLHRRRRDPKAVEREALFAALTAFAALSYFVPQIAFYSSETYGVEQFTEISKFFFAAHFALALLSVFGVAYLKRFRRWWVVAPCFLAAAVTPVLFCYANSVDAKGSWIGFYHSPYFAHSIEEQMGEALGRLKKTNHDVFYDASDDETRHGFLSELLLYGGSVFTMTPSRYERTGIGYRLSEDAVARRYAQNGRMARLLPGAPESAGCTWYYCRPLVDMVLPPVIVRSRFAKLVAEGTFVPEFQAGLRTLYAIGKPTADLDREIERYWSPRIVAQSVSACAGSAPAFYDYAGKKILCGRTAIDLPDGLRDEFVNVHAVRLPGGAGPDFMVARMKDTYFHLGKRVEDLVDRDPWGWSLRDSKSGRWRPEYEHWFWDYDIPFAADLDHGGFTGLLVYRPSSGEWLAAPLDQNQLTPDKSLLAADWSIAGPVVKKDLLPVPFAGRFLDGSKGDLGIWSLMDGMVTLKTIATGKSVSFRWGGTYGFILVPGDYDGIGRDEIAVYNQNDLTWYWHRAPDGPLSAAKFGTKTGIPVPWDYNHDGRLDLAYWEPLENKIYVSFDRGRSVGLVVKVPPHSIPAFVDMR